MIYLALDGGLSQDLGGLLERGCGEEGLGGQRGLGDAHEDAGSGGQAQLHPIVGLSGVDTGLNGSLGVLIFNQFNCRTGEQRRVTGVLHPNLAHHLAADNLNMLVVDVHALLTVRFLDFLNQIVVHRVDPPDADNVLGIERAVGEGKPLLHCIAALDTDAGAVGKGIGDHLAVVGGDGQVAHRVTLGLLYRDLAADLGQLGHFLGLAGLKELLNAGKALGDVAASHAAGVEGTHGELSARLTDRLSGDDAHRLAGAHGLSGGQVDAVALGAHAAAGAASEHRTDFHRRNTVGLQCGRVLRPKHSMVVKQELSGLGIHDILHGVAALEALAEGLDDLTVLGDLGDGNAVVGAAVLLPDDNLLRHIHQAAGQVARVGGPQGGIGQTLPGSSGGDKVLQHAQALAEVGLDGDFDGAAGGVSHQATHSGQLADLGGGAAGAGVGHHPDGVVAIQALHQSVGDVLGGLLPGLHHQAVTLVIGEEAPLELALNLDNLFLRGGDEPGLFGRHSHIGDGHRESAPGGELIPPRLYGVQHPGGDGETVLGDALVNDLAQLLLAGDEVDLRFKHGLGIAAIHEAQVLGDPLVEDKTAHGGAHQLVTDFAVHLAVAANQNGHMQLQLALVIGQAGLGIVGEDMEALLGQLAVGDFGTEACISGDVVQTAGILNPDIGVGGHAPLCQSGLYGRHILIGLLGGVGGITLIGQIVGAQHHILGGHGDRAAVLRPQQIVG